MSDAKRFEDWIIFDAHESNYADGESMSEDAFAFQLEYQDLRAKWESARQTMTEIVEHGCVLHTEDGLCCYYCEADAEYPDDSGDYEHFELPHTTKCIWAKARDMLAANAPEPAP